jgi:anaerobic magnesium-protoporphyrin IX monomethyl ester cyclase
VKWNRVTFVNPLTLPLEVLEASGGAGMQNLAQEGVSMPMGIMYLSSHIKRETPGIEVELIDYRANYPRLRELSDLDSFIERIALEVISSPPDLLAFSIVVSASHGFFKRALQRLKLLWPNACVIVGGFHATNFTRELLRLPEIDYVFRGESEASLMAFLRQGGAQPPIPGVVTKGSVEQMANTLAVPLLSMDENPMPDYGLIDMDSYTDGNSRVVIKRARYGTLKSANLMTSLGCPFPCTFCASRTVHGRKMRYKSVENVVREVRYLNETWGITLFLPEDDLFTANKKRTLALLRALRALNIPGFLMQFPVALSVNTLDEELLDELIATGMDVASLAIESGSNFVQRHIINKSVKLDKAKFLVRHLRARDIPVRCSFVLGFPHETRDQMQESIDFAVELGADWNDFFVATPLAGSEMCEQFIELGYIPNDIERLSLGYYSKRTFDSAEISAQALSDLTYYANLYCNFTNNINLRLGSWDRALELFEPIANKYPFHLIAFDCLLRCYRGLGRLESVQATEAHLKEAFRSDERAQEMFRKYGELLQPATRTTLLGAA